MEFKEYVTDMKRCNRCSYCKFIPYMKMDKKEYETGCPSIAKYNFHAYSAGGRLIAGLSFLLGRTDYSDTLLDIIYKCQLDGSCDISCKNQRDMEPLQAMLELRAKCVEDGQLLPAHMIVIDNLKKEDNMMQQPKSKRGDWAEGLNVKDLTKDKAEVLYHAGCRFSFDEALWPIARKTVTLLSNSGVDLGIMGKDETCCGGRAYEMGYQGELVKYAEHNIENWKTSGVKTIVTSCSDCYQFFSVLYDKVGKKPKIEVLHITQYLAKMVNEGVIKLKKKVPITVTYHDPCHLGRLGEPWIHWGGKETKLREGLVGLIIHDPPKVFRRGANGIYEPPRDIIRGIPGLKFVEMERVREYAWCCGAGGGVFEAYPDFALWTANERIMEAEQTGADAIVTACPWCERSFLNAIDEKGYKINIYDIVDLIELAI